MDSTDSPEVLLESLKPSRGCLDLEVRFLYLLKPNTLGLKAGVMCRWKWIGMDTVQNSSFGESCWN